MPSQRTASSRTPELPCSAPPSGTRPTELQTALRDALERDQLTLHYQPQVELASGRIRAVEALLRWHHPVWGAIRPDAFLPLAEAGGLIAPVGRWVLQRACSDLCRWKRMGVAGIRVAVNLSPHQFLDRGLTGEVALALADRHLKAGEIELEITESAAMPHLDYSVRMLRDLRDLGMQIAIDDFGTGFSSLAQLRRLPVSCLKLDRGLVRDIHRDPADTAIAAAVIGLAHRLGLEVVAEGVERPEQLAVLRRHDCQSVQGFLLARPLPEKRLLPLLLTQRPLTAVA